MSYVIFILSIYSFPEFRPHRYDTFSENDSHVLFCPEAFSYSIPSALECIPPSFYWWDGV
jgi:hypothetical protein